jgi:hypothetical protein
MKSIHIKQMTVAKMNLQKRHYFPAHAAGGTVQDYYKCNQYYCSMKQAFEEHSDKQINSLLWMCRHDNRELEGAADKAVEILSFVKQFSRKHILPCNIHRG